MNLAKPWPAVFRPVPMFLWLRAFTLTPGQDSPEPASPADSVVGLAALRTDADRLTDLTLLVPDDQITMHPWTAALVTRNTATDTTALHERALAMRWRRFQQRRGTYEDLLDIPRHLAALGRWDDIAEVTLQATQALTGTLTTVAYLAETRALIPPDNGPGPPS
jgi:hypothetical protein